MNSREALRTIERYVEYNCDREFEIVFQDLDRLKQLEKENSYLKLLYDNIIDCIKKFNDKIIDCIQDFNNNEEDVNE